MYVWSAGNFGLLERYSCAYDPYTNSRFTIAITGASSSGWYLGMLPLRSTVIYICMYIRVQCTQHTLLSNQKGGHVPYFCFLTAGKMLPTGEMCSAILVTAHSQDSFDTFGFTTKRIVCTDFYFLLYN